MFIFLNRIGIVDLLVMLIRLDQRIISDRILKPKIKTQLHQNLVALELRRDQLSDKMLPNSNNQFLNQSDQMTQCNMLNSLDKINQTTLHTCLISNNSRINTSNSKTNKCNIIFLTQSLYYQISSTSYSCPKNQKRLLNLEHQ